MYLSGIGWKYGRYSAKSVSTIVYTPVATAQGAYHCVSTSKGNYRGVAIQPPQVQSQSTAQVGPPTPLQNALAQAAGPQPPVPPRKKSKVWPVLSYTREGVPYINHVYHRPSFMHEDEAIYI